MRERFPACELPADGRVPLPASRDMADVGADCKDVLGWAAVEAVSEAIGTAVLVVVADSIGSHAVSATGPAPGFAPWLVASLVWGIGLSLGATTGYAINPARDLGPRIAHAVLPIPGKGGSDWGYAGIPIVGPLVGASIAGFLLRALHI